MKKRYDVYQGDVEIGIVKDVKPSPTTRIKKANVDIHGLEQSVRKLEDLHADLKGAFGAEKREFEGKIQAQLAAVKTQLGRTVTAVKQLSVEQQEDDKKAVAFLDSDPPRIEELKALVGDDAGRYKQRRSDVAELQRQLKRVADAVSHWEDKMHHEQREVVKEQLETALNQAVSDDEVDQVMETPGALQKIVEDELGRGGAALQRTVEQLQGRVDAAHKLLQEVLVINEMMKQMQAEVHAQGEMIDGIQHRIESALDKAKVGNVQLEKARKSWSERMKTKSCVILTVLALLAILILGLVFGLVPL